MPWHTSTKKTSGDRWKKQNIKEKKSCQIRSILAVKKKKKLCMLSLHKNATNSLGLFAAYRSCGRTLTINRKKINVITRWNPIFANEAYATHLLKQSQMNERVLATSVLNEWNASLSYSSWAEHVELYRILVNKLLKYSIVIGSSK